MLWLRMYFIWHKRKQQQDKIYIGIVLQHRPTPSNGVWHLAFGKTEGELADLVLTLSTLIDKLHLSLTERDPETQFLNGVQHTIAHRHKFIL